MNNRRARVAGLESALEAGYHGLLPSGRHPVGALFVVGPPSLVDVNVHPSKEQVRLQLEPELAAGLQDIVRSLISASPA